MLDADFINLMWHGYELELLCVFSFLSWKTFVFSLYLLGCSSYYIIGTGSFLEKGGTVPSGPPGWAILFFLFLFVLHIWPPIEYELRVLRVFLSWSSCFSCSFVSLQTSALQLGARKERGGGEKWGLWWIDAQSLGVGRGQETDCEKSQGFHICWGWQILGYYICFCQLKQFHTWKQ